MFRRYWLWCLVIVFLALISAAYSLGRASVYRANPGLSGQEQAATIIKRVGELIQLPTTEVPTLATINDAASAKQQQPFLVNAQNGDVLIVYPQAGEALLYRPSTNKLIAVGPVYTGAQGQTAPTQILPTAASTTSNATSTKKKK